MDFKVVVPVEQAEQDLQAWMDKKMIFPKRREALTPAIDTLIEQISYGNVAIEDDGSLTQKLIMPVGSTSELKYAPRISPLIVNKELQGLKNDNQANRNVTYIKLYTGQVANTINSLEPVDRTTADCIAFFFQ